MGRSDFAPEHNEGGELVFDEEEIAIDKIQQRELQRQFGLLGKAHRTLTPGVVINDLLDIFEKIHHAFVQGILSDVKNFLSPAIQGQFENEIKQRKGYQLHILFLRKPECFIKQIDIDDDKNCTIDTEFASEQLVYIEDKNGVIVDNPHKLSETIRNYWVFKKNLANLSAPWMLVEMV